MVSVEARPVCPRCHKASGLRLEAPAGPYNPVFRCDGRLAGCGYLWSPRGDGDASRSS